MLFAAVLSFISYLFPTALSPGFKSREDVRSKSISIWNRSSMCDHHLSRKQRSIFHSTDRHTETESLRISARFDRTFRWAPMIFIVDRRDSIQSVNRCVLEFVGFTVRRRIVDLIWWNSAHDDFERGTNDSPFEVNFTERHITKENDNEVQAEKFHHRERSNIIGRYNRSKTFIRFFLLALLNDFLNRS